MTPEEMVNYREACRQLDLSVVFTNGCFDLLGFHHLTCLQFARRQGDILLVGVNSDASVRRLKGEGRPLIPQEHRSAMLSALRCVDAVAVFYDDTPEHLVERLRPDTLVKGAEYQGLEVAGSRHAGRVLYAPMIEACSTSSLLKKIRGG